jgi:hypothetical protein
LPKQFKLIDGMNPGFQWDQVAAGNGVILASGYDEDEYMKYYYSSKPGEWELKEFPIEMAGDLEPTLDGVNWSKLKTFTPNIKRIFSNGSNMMVRSNISLVSDIVKFIVYKKDLYLQLGLCEGVISRCTP